VLSLSRIKSTARGSQNKQNCLWHP
jgi:hypothetical protein